MSATLIVLVVITPRAHAPGSSDQTGVTRTPLPEGFTIIPPFVPSLPCELQNVDLYDEELCRSERVQETAVTESEQTVLYTRDYHVGTGCWSGINVDIRELRVCQRDSGAVAMLASHVAGNLIASPDGESYAFVVTDLGRSREDDVTSFVVDVLRVSSNGASLVQLDSSDLPPGTAGAQVIGWSEDGDWLELSLWDGTEDGWHPYRLRTDGSGEYEAAPEAT
jgi:hypothetical protein